MTDYKTDFLQMKQSQRESVTDKIIVSGVALEQHENPQIWRDTMKKESTKALGRVRRFYRYLANFSDSEIDAFLRAFLS